MKNRKNILTYMVAALSILVTSASSSQAAPAQTYHGTLTGGTFYCDGTPAAGPIVTGNWNVNIDPKTPAQVTLNVFYDGSHHLAFGYNALMLVLYVDGVYVFAGFGDAATATLDTNADSSDVLLARRFRRRLPSRASLQLADVLRTGEPRRWIRAARGNNRQFNQTKPNDENGQK